MLTKLKLCISFEKSSGKLSAIILLLIILFTNRKDDQRIIMFFMKINKLTRIVCTVWWYWNISVRIIYAEYRLSFIDCNLICLVLTSIIDYSYVDSYLRISWINKVKYYLNSLFLNTRRIYIDLVTSYQLSEVEKKIC